MWLAGALEGYAAAVLLAIKLGLPLEEVLAKDLKAVGPEGGSKGPAGAKECTHVVKALLVAQEKAAEAIRLYSRSVVFCGLEVECALRVAKMQEMIGVDVRRHRWYGREQRAWAYVLHAMRCGPQCAATDRVRHRGALICKCLQLRRKYAFLLYVAALMCAESDNTAMAHALMRNACSQYGIAADSPPCINKGASPRAGRQRQRLYSVQPPPGVCWSWKGARHLCCWNRLLCLRRRGHSGGEPSGLLGISAGVAAGARSALGSRCGRCEVVCTFRFCPGEASDEAVCSCYGDYGACGVCHCPHE